MKRIFAWWKGETCPQCASWKVIKGIGYAQLQCSQCKAVWEIRDIDGSADAPQVHGKRTCYEDSLI